MVWPRKAESRESQSGEHGSMNIPWAGTKCILCLSEEKLTTEHVIPRSLGGALTCKFLCRSCNSKLGSDIEDSIKSDPDILQLAWKSADSNPHLAEIVDSHPQVGESAPGPVEGFIKNDEFQIFPGEQEDGSLLLVDAREYFTKRLRKEGHTTAEIDKAIAKLRNLKDNEEAEVSPGYLVTNWSVENVRPDISKSRKMSLLVPAVIAFEFMALLAEDAIYGEEPLLSELRAVLLRRKQNSGVLRVQRLHASKAGSSLFHGIAFEGSAPYASVQIRLLGRLAFRVQFHHWVVNGPRVVYTHDLESGNHFCRVHDDFGS